MMHENLQNGQKIARRQRFAEAVRDILTAGGAATQADLAKLAGISPTNISNALKDNDVSIGPKTLRCIHQAWPAVSLDWLLYGHGPKLTGRIVRPQRMPSRSYSYDEPEAAVIVRDNADLSEINSYLLSRIRELEEEVRLLRAERDDLQRVAALKLLRLTDERLSVVLAKALAAVAGSTSVSRSSEGPASGPSAV